MEALRAQLCGGGFSLVEDQAFHIVGQVDQRDLGFSASDADGSDKQSHLAFLLSEDRLDVGADFGLGGIAAPDVVRHRFPLGLLEMDP